MNVFSSPSLLNEYLRYVKLWGPSQRVVTLLYKKKTNHPDSLRSSIKLLRQNLRVKSDGGSGLNDYWERLNRDLVQGGWFGTPIWSGNMLNKFHDVYYTNISPQKPYSTSVGGAAYNKKRIVNRHIVDFNINVIVQS